MFDFFMNPTVRGCLCVTGGFLVHFSLGTLYTFGNLSPYISSYLFSLDKGAVTSADVVWIYALAFAFQGITMMFGGTVQKYIGIRLTTLIGSWIMSIGVMTTYFSIQRNIYCTILTYGVLFGTGVGIAYSVAISAAIQWFEARKGFIIGIVVGGFGLGSLVFNQVQTAFINPENLRPNLTIGSDKYFTDQEMLQRVPFSFLLTGGIYAVLQLIGSLLLFRPNVNDIEVQLSTTQDTISESQSFSVENEVFEFDRRSIASKDNLVVEEKTDYGPLRAIKTLDFWLLWISFLCNATCNVFVTSLYKTFGQTFLEDDRFLAIVGSVAAIFNAGGRIVWGQIMDRTSYKFSMRIMTVMAMVLTSTFYTTKLVKTDGVRAMYFIWVCAMLGSICGTFSLMPSATAKRFGKKHVAINYGMVFTSNSIAAVVGALATSLLESKIGYLGIFQIGAGLLVFPFIITFLFSKKDL